MGVTPLFCCFKKQNPLCVVITALLANVIAIFAFLLLIKGEIDLIAIIFFVIKILCLFSFILILIYFRACIDTKKIARKKLCFFILALCFIDFIFFLIGSIIDLKNNELNIIKEIPTIIILICLAIMALCANYLFKVFKDMIDSSSQKVDQSTENSNIHRQQQPELFHNDRGMNYPVIIK